MPPGDTVAGERDFLRMIIIYDARTAGAKA